MERAKMHKRLSLAGFSLIVSALLAGCGDSAAPTAAPSVTPSKQPAAASSVAPPAEAPTRPEIVRGSLRFIEGYEAGYAAAAAQKKPMLLFFTASWCHFCHQLAADAFNDATVVSLSERFVCVLVDADREPQVCSYFRVGKYPTIQFVSARGQLLNRMVGKRPGSELSRQMHAALQTLARTTEDRQATF
jgi:thiol-disulfide isomerase/thioredoxin